LKAQREEAYRYWRSVPVAERMRAVAEIIRDGYSLKGIDFDQRLLDKNLVRVDRREWKFINLNAPYSFASFFSRSGT
jgi:hypothetical protein